MAWLRHDKQDQLRPDLAHSDLVQMAEYLVGEGKGPDGSLPTMFANIEPTQDFNQRWLKRDRALDVGQPGYDKHTKKWPLMQAWCVELATGRPWPENREREQRHYRLMLSPDPKLWKQIGRTDRQDQAVAVQLLTEQVIRRLENEMNQRLVAVSSVHLNTPQTHSHTCIRGRDLNGSKVFLMPKFWNEAIRRWARGILWDMFISRKATANVG